MTDALLAEANLQSNEDNLRDEIGLLAGYSTDVVYRLRYDTMRYDYISHAATKLLGFSSEELADMNIRSLIEETRLVSNGLRSVESFDSLEQHRKEGEVLKWQADYLMRTKDGRKVWVSDVSYPWFDDKGAIIGSIGTLRDITERVEAEQVQQKEAAEKYRNDEVTGLSSRAVFFERLDSELKRGKRSRADVSVMVVSVDNLQQIQEKYGRPAKHTLLKEVAKAVRSSLRDTDLAARITDDEFALCLPDTRVEGAFWVGERIRESVLKSQCKTECGAMLACTVSVGISGSHFDDNQNSSGLYKTAESRLFIAKTMGQNRVSIDEIVSLH